LKLDLQQLIFILLGKSMKYHNKFIILLISSFIFSFSECQFSQSTPFDFTDQFNVFRGEGIISNAVTISGLQEESNISISGGAYSINNNDFTTESGTVNNQDEVRIMLRASGDYGKVTTSKITVGEFNANFSVRTEDSPDSGWAIVPAIMDSINPPVFPDTNFIITDYGAVGDGTTDCTDAFKDAISSCNLAGGGRVVVPEGTFLTGAIHLKSNVNLYVSTNATIQFSQNYSDYLPVVYTRFEGTECYNYSPPIYAFEQENIAITGRGTINGGGDNSHWWPWTSSASQDVNNLRQQAEDGVPVENRIYGEGHYLRPNMIQPYRCKNILIDSVTIINSPMWHIHPVLCENLIVSNVTVEGPGPNNDGCNPESCKNVLIENCFFNTGDDCIAIKSGRNADGRRVNVPSENIIIKGCTMKDGHGGVVLGSEITGGARNVFASDCNMDSPNLDRALRIKTNSIRGGIIENIYLKDITVGTIADAGVRVNFFYGEGDIAEFTPVVRNIEVRNMTCEHTKYALRLEGYERSKISDIRLINCSFNNASSNNILSNIQNIGLNNVTINGVTYNKILEPVGEEPTSVGRPQGLNISQSIELKQNYPNPFNPTTKIRYAIPDIGTSFMKFVKLKVYDILGNEVATLVNEEKPAGNYEVTFYARSYGGSNLPNGIYFYRLQAGSFMQTKKLILLK
jgi:polygalacturonase